MNSIVVGFLYFVAVVLMLIGIAFLLFFPISPPSPFSPSAISNTGVSMTSGGINNTFSELANGINAVYSEVYASVNGDSYNLSLQHVGIVSFLIGMTILIFTKLSVIEGKISETHYRR